MPALTEWWGKRVAPAVGVYVQPDEWRFGACLTEGDDFSTFRLPTNSGGPIQSLACEVKVTGRTAQRRPGDSYAVRVEITFPGDGTPDTVCGGWMNLPE